MSRPSIAIRGWLIAGLVAAAAAAPARAQAPPTVTLEAVRAPLPQVFAQVFTGVGLRYTVPADLSTSIVSAGFRDFSLTDALRFLTQAASDRERVLVYRIVEGEYVFTYVRRDLVEVTASLPATPLREALATIFTGKTHRLTLAPDVPNFPVDLYVRDVRVEQALEAVTRIARTIEPRLSYDWGDEEARVFLADEPRPTLLPLPPGSRTLLRGNRGASAFASRRGGSLVDIDLTATPLREVIRAAVSDGSFSIAIAPDVPDVRISVTLRQASRDDAVITAVRLAAEQQPGIRLVRDGPIYFVAMDPAPPPAE